MNGNVSARRTAPGEAERIRQAGHTVVGYAHEADVADVHSLREMVDA
ncbi:6-phosphogluconate dehydrogenase, partial [Streptomyces sp. NPDC049881]